METIRELSFQCTSPSMVEFDQQIDPNCTSTGNPDWTIQKETSVTIDKTINESNKFWNKKTQFLVGTVVLFALILSISIPIIVLSTNSSSSSSQTTVITTQSQLNSSNKRIEKIVCETSMKTSNIFWINFDLHWERSSSLSDCCLLCLNHFKCRAFIYDRISSKCYLKSLVNENEKIVDQRYESVEIFL